MEVWGGNQAVDCGVVMSGLDAWLYARPCDGQAVGGDVHYVSSCATGRVTRVLIADVSGHGATVADTGVALRELMRRYVNHLDQTRFVIELNRAFGALVGEGRFATTVVATFFAPTNRLTVSSAGHLPPMHFDRRRGSWSAIQGAPSNRGLPLGVLDTEEFGQDDVELRVGDLVLLYTDSLTEASRADGAMLGTDGLLELLATLDAERPGAIVRGLIDRIDAMHDGNLDRDDVTALLIRPNGLAPRVPLGRRLAAPFRLIGALGRSLRPGGRAMPWPQLNLASIGGYFFQPLNRRWRANR